MKFIRVGEQVHVVHSNGGVDVCDNIEQAWEICHFAVELMRTMLGRKAPEKVRRIPVGVLGRRGGIEKKKVIITIDNNPQKIKDLA